MDRQNQPKPIHDLQEEHHTAVEHIFPPGCSIMLASREAYSIISDLKVWSRNELQGRSIKYV